MPKPVRTTIFKCLPHYYSALDGGLFFPNAFLSKAGQKYEKNNDSKS
jgi:hypothetical protein